MFNTLLDVVNSGVIDNTTTGSSEPSNKNWNQIENNEFTNGFLIGFFIAIVICIFIKLCSLAFKKYINHISKPIDNNEEKSD